MNILEKICNSKLKEVETLKKKKGIEFFLENKPVFKSNNFIEKLKKKMKKNIILLQKLKKNLQALV